MSDASAQEGFQLFITENIADNTLAIALNESLNSSGDIINIKTSEDLNKLFFDKDYLNTYSQIVMILDQSQYEI